MKNLIFGACLLFAATTATAEDFDLKLACKAAMSGMPDGSGTTVYYANGRTLTTSAGKSGATWYYPNGRTLSTNISVPGATYYHSNGRTFSTNTGKEGATWYYADGRTVTVSAPALSPVEMAELACDLILNGEYELK